MSLLLLKLMLEDYDIHFVALSKAVVAALIVAEVVVILRNRKFMNRFSHRPGYISVLYKTFVYIAGVFVVLLLEKTIEAYGEAGGFGPALRHVVESKDLSHAAGVTLICATLFLFYNAQEQLNRRIGGENLRAAFFAAPSATEKRDT